ncbi:MAG TPA: dockerin type I domain-containing protein, partial [Candidatus Polarisedimenticolia bacterium]|nr:dockerin type I domain-containing protein [Candidatus Polarisedimenticolia bacterium]
TRLVFGAEAVTCATPSVPLILTDRDLDFDPTAIDATTVHVRSTSDPAGLTLDLAETQAGSGMFTASLPLGPQGDGTTLQVAPGDQVVAEHDETPGGSGPLVSASIAVRGCSGPRLTGLTKRIDGDTITLRWATDVASNSEVTLAPASGPALAVASHRMVTSHELTVRGLAPCAQYSITVASRDIDGVRGTLTEGGDELLVEQARRTVLFADDMEGPDPGWTTTGPPTPWARGIPSKGPGAAYSGQRVYATDLASPYLVGTNSTLTSPPIDLRSVSQARLTFRHWYNIFAKNPPLSFDDAGWVEVSSSGASAPVYLEPVGGYNDVSDSEFGQPLASGTPVYAGFSDDWERAVFDLSQFAGETIRLRFRLWNDRGDASVNGATGAGWLLDDVEVSSATFCFPAPALGQGPLPELAPGATAVGLVVSGTGFRAGTKISLGAGVTVTDVNVVSPTRIEFTASAAPAATLGPRDVHIVNPDDQSAVMPGGLTIVFSPRRADMDGSGRVDGGDLFMLAAAFGSRVGEPAYTQAADLDGDGAIDGLDLALLATSFGSSF